MRSSAAVNQPTWMHFLKQLNSQRTPANSDSSFRLAMQQNGLNSCRAYWHVCPSVFVMTPILHQPHFPHSRLNALQWNVVNDIGFGYVVICFSIWFAMEAKITCIEKIAGHHNHIEHFTQLNIVH